MTLSEQFKKTETFFDAHNGDIVCITRVDERGSMVYGKYCTGPQEASDLEFAFRPKVDILLPKKEQP